MVGNQEISNEIINLLKALGYIKASPEFARKAILLLKNVEEPQKSEKAQHLTNIIRASNGKAEEAIYAELLE